MASTSADLLTIGALARQAGVSAQTLRHYDRLGLLRPSATTAAGYRLYTERDRARLDLVRALRGLDLDLPTIGRLLRGAAGVGAVAELHLRALDLQARAIERRRAVLRVVLRGAGPPTAERLARLHVLAGLERLERERFLAERLDERLRGAGGPAALQRWIRDGAVLDLPESPTEAQVEAWLELAEMVSDPTYLERYRGTPSPAWARDVDADPERWRREMMAVYRPAAAAAAAGIDPGSEQARPAVRRWVRAFARRQGRTDLRVFGREMLRGIESAHDAREARFWELVGILKPQVARSPISVGWPWLVAGLRAWVGEDR